MEIKQLKLRLIQLVLEIDNQEVLLKVLEIAQNFEAKTDPWDELPQETENATEVDAQALMTRFKTLMGDCEDEETRDRILAEEFTSDERLSLVLFFRLEDIKKHPEQRIDEETFFRNLRNHKKNETI